MKLLIADDNNTERLILSRVLENLGHEIIQAENGLIAVEKFKEFKPDMVFLDVMMPEMDGYQVAESIQPAKEKSWFPIVFLTSLTEASDLAKCIDVGGDDFVSKPINKIIIKAKVEAFERLINLYNTVAKQQEEIRIYNEHLVQEQEAAKVVFNNVAHRGCLDSDYINYHLSAMSIFNGDLMLAMVLPTGALRIMLGDFTGHGLPAAIGALPTSEIFYGMSKKGFSLEDLIKETNARLYNILPRGIFCCCVIADINPADKQIKIWSAGAPDTYLIDKENEEVTLLHSSHLPLGILSPNAFNAKFKSYPFTENHKLITATDGIIESPDKNDKMFGEKRMLDYITDNIFSENICDGLLEEVEKYIGEVGQDDDLSLLEVSFPDTVETTQLSKSTDENKKRGTADSEFTLKLRGQSLNEFDPIPLFLQTILECNELLPHRTRIFTVLTELYNNALDHGVLGLDSALKSSSTGFADYYQQRADGLTSLTDDFVEVSVDHQPTEIGGKLIFIISDSGKGFDVKKIMNRGSQAFSGRGLPLLLQLCSSVDYLDGGTKVKAVYEWDENDIPD